MTRVATVVGARPQFIKAAPLSVALREAGLSELLIHTGQHYDHGMSEVFFEELGLPRPEVNLGVGSGPHGWQTAAILTRIEEVLLAERPDWLLVFGDTNSTLAGALAAAKLSIPVAHVEAGLRSFQRAMPEEHNRVLTDHCSDLLFCPTQDAVDQLAREGIREGVHLVGDPMADVLEQQLPRARQRPCLANLGLEAGAYLLATLHRPANVDEPAALRRLLDALGSLGEAVVFPVHPRTRERIAALEPAWTPPSSLRLLEPVSYLDMLALLDGARGVLTDSGGLQKEAYLTATPCVTLREETEWTSTVEAGWNRLAGSDPARIREAVALSPPSARPQLFGAGDSSEQIARLLAASA